MLTRLFSILFLLFGLQVISAQNIDFKDFEAFKFRAIGPAGMSGRITAIDVNLRHTGHILIGSASGGVWESLNGGISWKPIFDKQPTQSIGAVRINQNNPDEIWVGTGEGNPRNSHNSGAGIFKSIDGGQSWTYMGLKETKLIHRIIIHPHDPKTVFVGAMGSAWGDSEHRGVYKTTDGGATWKKILYIDKNVGVCDLVADPSNPNKMIAGLWAFRRTPWNFESGGEGSGLYITYDAGANWKKLGKEEGLPGGQTGRSGVAFARSKPDIVYALVESDKHTLYKSSDGGATWKFVSDKNVGNRPFYYTEIYVDPTNENRIFNLWSYVSKSEDGGKTFETIMDYGNAVHPDHHAFWIHPEDPAFMIDGNDGGVNISRDGGQTWRFIHNIPVGQFYHVNVDDDFPYNIYGGMQDNGSWVGPGFVLKSGGIRNYDWQELYFGDGFDVSPKPGNTRYGYAMSQEGNLAMWDKVTGQTQFIRPNHPEGLRLRFNWNAAFAQDPHTTCGIYYGSQYVHYSADCGQSWTTISPDLTTNDTLKIKASRNSGGLTKDVTGAENHCTVLCIAPSPFNKELLWAGTDDGRLHKTEDGGANWLLMNARLPGLPKGAWIPQIELSEVNEQEIFVVVNNYRMNDWSPYLFHSKDGGKSWRNLASGKDIGGFVTSVKQDPECEDLIFMGTDVGLYISFDHGRNWKKWNKGLPSVQIRDIAIQKTMHDLVLGTFGRSFLVLDGITPLREISRNPGILETAFNVFPAPEVYLTEYRSYDGIRFIAQGEFVGENRIPDAVFSVWKKPAKKDEMKNGATAIKEKDGSISKKDEGPEKDNKHKEDDKLTITVINSSGDTIRILKRNLEDGLNRITWSPDSKGVHFPRRSESREDSEPGGMPIIPGTYKVLFQYGNDVDSTFLTVSDDPRTDRSVSDIEAKYKAMSDFNGTVEIATQALENLKEAKNQVRLYRKIIEVQHDSIQKDMKAKSKVIERKIDTLMHQYFLPGEGGGYRDDAHLLTTYLRSARRYLRAAKGAPGPNGQLAVDKAVSETTRVVSLVNAFIEGDWSEYQASVKALPMDIFKKIESVRLE